MKHITRVLMAMLVAALAMWGALQVTAGQEKKVTFDELPAAVQAAVEKAAAGGEILELEAEEEDGQMEYEAKIRRDGKVIEVEFDAAGNVLADDADDDEGDDEETIAFADAPAAVQKAVEAYFGQGKVQRLEVEKENGVLVYEAEIKIDGVEHSIEVSADGELLEVEHDVAPDALPAAVRAALDKKFPGAAIDEAEAIQKFYYEVEIIVDGKKKEVTISPTGKISSMDDDDDDDEDDDDDD